MFFKVENDGQKIVSTNYWDSDHAKRGLIFISINAGCFRVLIPRAAREFIHEMRIAKIKEVVVSRGSWQGRDCLEFLFEDGKDDPLSCCIQVEQVDRLPLSEDTEKTWICSVYSEQGQFRSYPCYYRIVPSLPWLKPRGENG